MPSPSPNPMATEYAENIIRQQEENSTRTIFKLALRLPRIVLDIAIFAVAGHDANTAIDPLDALVPLTYYAGPAICSIGSSFIFLIGDSRPRTRNRTFLALGIILNFLLCIGFAVATAKFAKPKPWEWVFTSDYFDDIDGTIDTPSMRNTQRALRTTVFGLGLLVLVLHFVDMVDTFIALRRRDKLQESLEAEFFAQEPEQQQQQEPQQELPPYSKSTNVEEKAVNVTSGQGS